MKLTQLGLDLSADLCFEHLNAIIECAEKDSIVWVDMEASNYVDATLDLYRRVLSVRPNVGICLQAYLYRTKNDLEKLLPLRPSIRLVKGAYNEAAAIAFQRKQEVDEKKEWMMWDREGYFEFLRGATGSVAGELKRRAAAAE